MALSRRPFADIGEHDEFLVANWNARVGRQDEVWHLGDVAVGPRSPGPAALFAGRLAARLERLHGRKHLVTGNNDPVGVRTWPGWHSVQPYAEIEVEGTALVLCHYALRSWNGMGRGAVNLHGHSHGRLAPMTRQFDVGVDIRDFRPTTLASLLRPGRHIPR